MLVYYTYYTNSNNMLYYNNNIIMYYMGVDMICNVMYYDIAVTIIQDL